MVTGVTATTLFCPAAGKLMANERRKLRQERIVYYDINYSYHILPQLNRWQAIFLAAGYLT